MFFIPQQHGQCGRDPGVLQSSSHVRGNAHEYPCVCYVWTNRPNPKHHDKTQDETECNPMRKSVLESTYLALRLLRRRRGECCFLPTHLRLSSVFTCFISSRSVLLTIFCISKENKDLKVPISSSSNPCSVSKSFALSSSNRIAMLFLRYGNIDKIIILYRRYELTILHQFTSIYHTQPFVVSFLHKLTDLER